MKSRRGAYSLARHLALFLAIPFALSFVPRVSGATKVALTVATPELSSADADANQLAIPPGTILPIRLGSLSSEKSKPGESIKARIMQDVPLGNGAKLRAGSTVIGRIVDVTPATSGAASLRLTFDTVVQGKETIPVLTNLRAMASTLEVESAQTPPIGPGKGDVYDWLTTVQVGGEVVYGKGGEVTNGDRVVGRSTYDGVLAQVNASEDARCRGAVEGNDRPQAFWVFSSDACGAYGFPYLTISHFGRSDPRGEIVLVSEHGPVKIRSGSGMLLRVQR
ncbi:MAG: hypothetical protein JWO71_815 [Candidatus Acidoferrum typicum]|nr:hypothetical protein [Candidatus Acidoferrum typicum]